ncbi:MAG: hypothetical protein KGI54_14490 [Pseudomonadota bacterium]|nr:hypothetical protein [Pseudomonadota bacterium]
MNTPTEKTCTICKALKPLSEFNKRSCSKDGHDYKCRPCAKASNKKTREKHGPKYVATTKNWRAAGNKAKRSPESVAKSRQKDREKYHADPDHREKVLKRQREAKQERLKIPGYREEQNAKSRANYFAKHPERRAYANTYTKEKRQTNEKYHDNEKMSNALIRLKRWQKDIHGSGFTRYYDSAPVNKEYLIYLHAWQANHCYFCNHTIGKRGDHPQYYEHILPRHHGGSDAKDNIVLTCENCNCSRQDKIFHLEWHPNHDVKMVENLFFLKQRTVGEALTANGIEWVKDSENNWMLVSPNGYARHLFILSTFFCSDRNPAAYNGKIAKYLQEEYEDPIILFDKEWFNRNAACINMMKSKLGISLRGPGARQLDVIEISPSEASVFLDAHHVMGQKANTLIRLGLTDGSSLHGVSLFSDKGSTWECDRLSFHGHIPGGMSKLMKNLWLLKGYKPIRSFVDSRYANGAGHEAIGFKYLGKSAESFQWVFPDRMQHQRYLSNFNKITRSLRYYDPSASKEDNIIANGVYKIYTPKRHVILYER